MRNKVGRRLLSVICLIAMMSSILSLYYSKDNVQAEMNQVTKITHTMATSGDYEAAKNLYVPRVSSRSDAESVKSISYDATNKAMKFTMGGWYNSSGCKVDVTDAIQSIIKEASTLDEEVTVGISAEVKGSGKDGGFGFLVNSDINLETTYIDSNFSTVSKEMSLDVFKNTYSSYNNLYVGFWSGDPDIYIKNFKVYYFTGQRETPIEMSEKTVIPDGSVGFLLHNLGTVNATLKDNYTTYLSGTLSNIGNALKYVGTTENSNNGIRLNVTDYVKKGKSGSVFGASLRINVDGWSSAEDNKANLFFEVKDSSNNIKNRYNLESDGPNQDASNITNSTSQVGIGWLTSLLSGEAAIEFSSTDTVYLCTNQKSITQYYNDVCLWGDLDTYEDVTDIVVKTPILNEKGDKVELSLKNLSEIDRDLIVQIKHYNNNNVSSLDEYAMCLASGTEDTSISLSASTGSEISIQDSTGKFYVESMKLGTYDWVGTWAAAQLTAGGDTTPPQPGLAGNTYRQMIRVSTGGTQLRLTFSNQNGASNLEINSVHLAKQLVSNSSEIDPTTDTIVTFGGKESIIVEPGKTVTSDLVEYPVEALEKVAVTTYFGQVPNVVTSHTAARCTNWLSAGNHVSDVILGNSSKATSWYFLEGIDVMSPEKNKAIVCFGDSITDGYGVTPNAYQRYSDVLAQRLQSNENTNHLSVLGEGIGGNSIYGGLGPAAKDRFDRDVINKSGVGYVVILIGINDIGYSNNISLADSMITQYKTMITKAHNKGIKVYMGTILPFKGNSYYSVNEGAVREQIRQKVNQWIKSDAAGIDGVIDFATDMADPNDPEKMVSQYANDYLHPNASGYEKMGNFVYETLFE